MFSRIFNAFKSNHILLSEVKNAAVITLNRPEKLNSFAPGMMPQIYKLIKELEVSDKSVVVIRGKGRAFCSGIDLASIQNYQSDTADSSCESFAMDLIQSYKKPYVAIIDGITMGGAAFISQTAKFCVATERTIFAMPEAAIGFYTNAGSSYFLSRLKNNLGMYIALTNARVEGYDVKKIGLASHFIESKNIENLIESLGDCKDDKDVSQAIEKFSATGPSKLDEIIPLIDKCFDGESVEEIYENLHLDGSEWAMQTIRIMNKLSPTSLKLCHRELTLGKSMSLRECLKMEHRMTFNIILHQNENFFEGIRAVIIDKDNNPKWNPSKLQDVKNEDIEKIFSPLPDELELKFDKVNPKL